MLIRFILSAILCLSAFGQAPTVPAQPSGAAYGFGSLQLFPTYTRDTFRAAYGAAPACDPSQPIKTWFDGTVDAAHQDATTVYNVPDAHGTAVVQLALSNRVAASVNLPGRETYPPYDPPATTAQVRGIGDPVTLNQIYLSTLAQATALKTELGGVNVVEQSLGGPFSYFYPPTETRRMYAVVMNGFTLNAGDLLRTKYANGVGAPGAWHINGSDVSWVPSPVPDCAGATLATPVPVRPLLPTEKIQVGLMGAQIVRSDLQAQQQAASGAFTDADRVALNKVLQILQKIMGGN